MVRWYHNLVIIAKFVLLLLQSGPQCGSAGVGRVGSSSLRSRRGGAWPRVEPLAANLFAGAADAATVRGLHLEMTPVTSEESSPSVATRAQ